MGKFVGVEWGLWEMVGMIGATDQLSWRRVIAWSDKFKYEQVESGSRLRSPLLHLLQQSRGLRSLRQHTVVPLEEGVYRRFDEEVTKRTRPLPCCEGGAAQSGEGAGLVGGGCF